MPGASSQYQTLIGKLDEFIRKYYKNQLIRGTIIVSGTLVLAFVLIAVAEYYGQFGTLTRTILFYTFSAATLLALFTYILVPLFRLYRFGKVISYEQASVIIGEHFPDIQDKLLNTLQLGRMAQEQPSNGLLLASIDQRIVALKPVPFVAAINLRRNLQYVRYAVVPVLALVLILALAPSIITDSSRRLLDYQTYYEKQAPFKFELQNRDLETAQNSDLVVQLKLTGSAIPDEVYLENNGHTFKMSKENVVNFTFTLKNLQRNTTFRFNADGYSSRAYDVHVLPQPIVSGFNIQLEYPAYIGKKNETLSNAGDITIPAGTRVRWDFTTRDVDQLSLVFQDEVLQAAQHGNFYQASKSFARNNTYTIKASNNQVKQGDSIGYQVQVIPDLYPTISVDEMADSLSPKLWYYVGKVEDDYGFRRLIFHYHFLQSKDAAKTQKPAVNIPISINNGSLAQSFYYQWDMHNLDIQPGEEIEYYFEVWDNDGVHGSKSTRSSPRIYKAPTQEEIEARTDKASADLKNKMAEAIRQSTSLEREVKEAQRKLVEKKQLGFEDRKQMQELLEKQQKLENLLNEIKEQQKRNNIQEQELNPFSDPELMKKQEELEKLMDEVLDEKMKEMIRELQELMQENNKDMLKEQLGQMEQNDKDLKKEMDRALELFKQLEIEKKMQQATEKLDEISKKEEELSNKTEDKALPQEELLKQQEQLDKEFKELQQDLEQLDQQNQELENPGDMPDTQEEQKEIEQEMKNSSEDLKQNNQKKASQKQKKAAQKMQEMKKKMEESMKKEQQEQESEDYNQLRAILDNLLEVSFEQERIINEFKSVNGYNPQYIELSQRQRKLKDDTRMIEDSLLALSKRQIQVKSFINKEISGINTNLERSIQSLSKRDTYDASYRQQMAMTSMNNLAVMLSEVLKQMQEQMNQNNQNSQSCQNPNKKGKGTKPNISDMKQLQEELNKQMQQMKDGKMPNQQGNKPNSMMFSKMAMQQEMIRRELQRLQDQMDKEGKKPGGMGKTQELMNETEKDLLNKRITPETVKRQQEILTRMLDHEKAIKEQENDNKRESNEGKETPRQVPPSLEEYIKEKNREQELLRTLPPDLNPYYRQRVKDYFQQIRR